MPGNRTIHEAAFRLSHDMSLQIKARLEKIGMDLTPQQMRSMRLIWSRHDVTLVDIASTLKRDKAQVVRLLDGLVKDGLVTREPNPADGRSKLLRLTGKANDLFGKIEAIEASFSDALTKEIPEEDLETFFRVSDLLSANLREIETPG